MFLVHLEAEISKYDYLSELTATNFKCKYFKLPKGENPHQPGWHYRDPIH